MDKEEIERLIAEAHQEEEEFRSLVPSTGWIGDYMRYTDRQESPGSYHFWVGATVMASVLQRRVWVNKGIYEVYPNLYTILIGPSGKCRKTRAMRLGLDLLEGYDWVNVMADKTTPEALLAALSFGTKSIEKDQDGKVGINPNPDAVGLVTAYELAVFISKQNYNTGMVSLLTDLYDCPPSFKYLTRNKRPLILNRPTVSVIGGSTPEWLATNLPADSFEGGFMSRVIYVVRHRKDRVISFPESPRAGEQNKLRQRIEEIHLGVSGQMSLSQPARKWFDQWYTSVEAIPLADASLSGFMERKPDTILKLGLILAVSAGHDGIDDKDLRTAHAIITWTQERMFQAFTHVDLSPLGVLQKKIIEFLELRGGFATRGQVLQKLWGRLRNGVYDLEQAEKVLVEAGILDVQVIHDGKPGRPQINYRLVQGGRP